MYLKGIFLLGLMIVSVTRFQVRATPVEAVGNVEEEQKNNEVRPIGSNEEDEELEIQPGDNDLEDYGNAVAGENVRGKSKGKGQGGQSSGGMPGGQSGMPGGQSGMPGGQSGMPGGQSGMPGGQSSSGGGMSKPGGKGQG